MTLNLALLWSVARCVIIASIAVWPVAVLVSRIETSPTVLSRRLRLLLAVFPFFLPELLIGFNYRLTVTQLTAGTSPLTAAIWTEALYGLLMLCRCMAVGVALSMLLPRNQTSDESLHSWVLLRRSLTPGTWWRGWLRLKVSGAWQAPLVAWSAMALVAFQEFETVALMQIDQHPISWSVWLFDAHAARLPLRDSLRMMAGPLLCELAILCPALRVLFLRRAFEGNDLTCSHVSTGRSSTWKSMRYSALLTPGIVLFVLWPLINNALPTMRGGLMMLENATLKQSLMQILTSTGFAVGATVLSMGVAIQICIAFSAAGRSKATRMLWMSLLVPGLLGSLVLSLGLVAMFQMPGLRGLYDTWLPMLLGQTLSVLPFAFIVVLLLIRVSDPTALHATHLMSESGDFSIRRQMAAIRWRLTTGRWLIGGLVVAHRCFWDVTVASILRPVQLEPVITRLYNEMHYGRTEALISLSALAALTPLGIAALAMLLSRLATISMSSR